MSSFSYLLKTRFEDKLDIVIGLHAEPGEYIVPMTCNYWWKMAVKHNEVSEEFPLLINIRKQDDYLEVENTLRIKHVGEDSEEYRIEKH